MGPYAVGRVGADGYLEAYVLGLVGLGRRNQRVGVGPRSRRRRMGKRMSLSSQKRSLAIKT